jgi:carboxymethylenebutenolidase
MCHEPGSVPPNFGEGAGAFEQQDLVLRSADGTEFSAYVATPEQPTGKAVVVLPDIRGLHAYYRELAAAFARSGIRAVAIDYFGRTAGLSADRGDDFDWMPHVRALTPDGVAADVAAAVDVLKHPASGPAPDVFTVGFCLGGGHSWRQAAVNPDVAGAIGFYGRPVVAEDVIGRVHAPLLMLVAGADDHIPRAESEDFHRRLVEGGAQADITVYEDAPHSFFDRSFDQFQAECADAGRRVLDFIARTPTKEAAR